MADNTRNTNAIDAHVGGQVETYRKLAGLSQEALGDAIGVTFQQVQKYEKGTNRISAGRLFSIARTLDVPISAFYEGLASEPAAVVVTGAASAKEGVDLMRAFVSIGDPDVRRHLSNLVRDVAWPSGPTSDRP